MSTNKEESQNRPIKEGTQNPAQPTPNHSAEQQGIDEARQKREDAPGKTKEEVRHTDTPKPTPEDTDIIEHTSWERPLKDEDEDRVL